MDREKVIKGMEMCISPDECSPDECPYYIRPNNESGLCWDRLMTDALALLKEQEAVKPVLDEQTGRIWLCGKCGAYVGFEDNDPHDPNEFDKYCRDCGRPVLWESR